MEQKIYGCEELKKADAEAASHVKSCDPKSLCDQSLNKPIDQLKGCFSGMADIGKEFWQAIASVPELAGQGAESIGSCLKDLVCRESLLKASLHNAQYTLMLANPIMAPLAFARMKMKGQIPDVDLAKLAETSKSLLAKGKDYLVKQGVKLACFDAKTQAEMVCYGVFSVVNPAGAAGLLAKAPKLGKLLKVTGLGAKEVRATEGAVDLARMAKLSNVERVVEAEKAVGRTLTEAQKDAVLKAHEVAADTGRGYGSYSAADLKQKSDLLKQAGFSDDEREKLMRQGIAGLYSDTQKARNFSNESRLQADKLRVAGKLPESTKAYRSAADSYEVFIKDAKAAKSERDYWVGASLNAHAERYDKAAEYYIKSKSMAFTKTDQRAQAIFEDLNREKEELRVIAFKNSKNAGAQKAYEDHRKMIEAIVKSPQITFGDAWKRELLKP